MEETAKVVSGPRAVRGRGQPDSMQRPIGVAQQQITSTPGPSSARIRPPRSRKKRWDGELLEVIHQLMGDRRSPFTSRIELIFDELMIAFQKVTGDAKVRKALARVPSLIISDEYGGKEYQTRIESGAELLFQAQKQCLIACSMLSFNAQYTGILDSLDAVCESEFRTEMMNLKGVSEQALLKIEGCLSLLNQEKLEGDPLIRDLIERIKALLSLIATAPQLLTLCEEEAEISIEEHFSLMAQRYEAAIATIKSIKSFKFLIKMPESIRPKALLEEYVRSLDEWAADFKILMEFSKNLKTRWQNWSQVTELQEEYQRVSAASVIRASRLTSAIEAAQRSIRERIQEVNELEELSWFVEFSNLALRGFFREFTLTEPKIAIELGLYDRSFLEPLCRSFNQLGKSSYQQFLRLMAARSANLKAGGRELGECFKSALRFTSLLNDLQKKLAVRLEERVEKEAEPRFLLTCARLLIQAILIEAKVKAEFDAFCRESRQTARLNMTSSERRYFDTLSQYFTLTSLITSVVHTGLSYPVAEYEKRSKSRFFSLSMTPPKRRSRKEEALLVEEEEVAEKELPLSKERAARDASLIQSERQAWEEPSPKTTLFSFSQEGVVPELRGYLKTISIYHPTMQGEDDLQLREAHLRSGKRNFLLGIQGIIGTLRSAPGELSYEQVMPLLDWLRRSLEATIELSTASLPLYNEAGHVVRTLYPRSERGGSLALSTQSHS